MTDRPLRRNRDFLLLQTGQLLSDVGSQSTSIAFPLLVLAMTGSAARAGVVAFARTVAWTFLSLPAGVAADRWNRRRLMLAADGVRVLAVGGLAAAVATPAGPRSGRSPWPPSPRAQGQPCSWPPRPGPCGRWCRPASCRRQWPP